MADVKKQTFEQTVDNTQAIGAIGQLTQSFTHAQAIFLGMTAMANAALLALLAPAAAMQDQILGAMQMVDVIGDDFAKLSYDMEVKAMGLSEKLNMSAAEIAGAFRAIIGAGISPLDEGFETLAETGMMLAKTGFTEPKETVLALSQILAQFNMGLDETTRVANAMFGAINRTRLEFGSLVESLKVVGGSALAAKQYCSGIGAAV